MDGLKEASKIISEKKDLREHGYFYRLKHFPWNEFIARLNKKPWLPLVPGVVSLIDKFVFVFPTDFVLAGTAMTCRKRWFLSALSTAIGGWFGCALLFLFVEWEPVREWGLWAITNLSESSVGEVKSLITKWGPFSTFIVAFSPLPMHLPVFFCAVAGLEFWPVLSWVFIGGIIRYSLIAYGVSHGWRVFKRFKPS